MLRCRKMIPGRVIDDKYRIRRVIGRGGMSVVAEAEDLIQGHRVAVKFLRTDVARALAAEPRFFREARLASRLMSRHTCRVSDVGVWESGPYLVLELLEGRTLAQELRVRRCFGSEQASEIALQACDALAEAHALGIVHRDVKPGNFFLCDKPDGRTHIKVLDFGVAKIPASVITRNGEGSLTDGNTLIGTPSYISPEQLQNSKIVDARTDVWSLGVILYEMLTGQPPFRDPWVPRMLVKIAREPHVPLREVCPDIDAALDRIVERCLEKNPADRFRGAAELGLALSDLAPPAEYLIERLMAFNDSVPIISTLSSSPPGCDSIDQLKMEMASQHSLDPFTTAVGHHRQKSKTASSLFAVLGGLLAAGLSVAIWMGHSTLAIDHVGASSSQQKLSATPSMNVAVASVGVPNTVRVELSATPTDARWSLDGSPLGNMARYAGQVVIDRQKHVLTASAPGYGSRSLTVYLDRDVSLSLALEPTPAPASLGSQRRQSPVTKPQEPPGLQHQLDESNPYGEGP